MLRMVERRRALWPAREPRSSRLLLPPRQAPVPRALLRSASYRAHLFARKLGRWASDHPVPRKLLLDQRVQHVAVAERNHGAVVGARQDGGVAESFGALVHEDRMEEIQQFPVARDPFRHFDSGNL